MHLLTSYKKSNVSFHFTDSDTSYHSSIKGSSTFLPALLWQGYHKYKYKYKTNTNTRQYSIFNLLPSLVSRHHRQGCQKSLNHKPLKRQNINGTDDTRSNFVPKIITRQTRTFVMSMSAGLGLLRAKLVSALSIVAIVLFTGLLYFLWNV